MTNQHAKKLPAKELVFARWIGGIAFTFFIAFLGYLLAKLPGFNLVGQLASAIVIAIAYRQIFGYPEALRSGIVFSGKKATQTCHCSIWIEIKHSYNHARWAWSARP